jgi:dephospho-CoA kinase
LIRGFIIHGKLGAQLCKYAIPYLRKSSFCFLVVNVFCSLVIIFQRLLVRAIVDHDPALASVLSVALTAAAIAAR